MGLLVENDGIAIQALVEKPLEKKKRGAIKIKKEGLRKAYEAKISNLR